MPQRAVLDAQTATLPGAPFLKLAAARATEPAEALGAPGQLSEASRSASDAW
jgi:hypothetical protein